MPESDAVYDALGYSLVPGYLPEGFKFHLCEIQKQHEPTVNIVYYDYNHHIFIKYPASLPSSGKESPLYEYLGVDWQRPEDAVSALSVDGRPAYLVRGNWSDETRLQLNNPDPELIPHFFSEWDYDGSLSLYFDFELSEDTSVGVQILAMFDPANWITAEEMTKIAEFIRQVE